MGGDGEEVRGRREGGKKGVMKGGSVSERE